MDAFIVAGIAAFAFIVGRITGYLAGRSAGVEEEAVRRRIAELPKPWLRG